MVGRILMFMWSFGALQLPTQVQDGEVLLRPRPLGAEWLGSNPAHRSWGQISCGFVRSSLSGLLLRNFKTKCISGKGVDPCCGNSHKQNMDIG